MESPAIGTIYFLQPAVVTAGFFYAHQLGLTLKRVGLDVILKKDRTTPAVQPVTVGSGPETEPRVDKIAATLAATLDRQADIAASVAAVNQTPVKKTVGNTVEKNQRHKHSNGGSFHWVMPALHAEGYPTRHQPWKFMAVVLKIQPE